MLRKVVCFFLFFCFFRDEEPEEQNYDNVRFKSYTPALADEPRCSIYKKEGLAA